MALMTGTAYWAAIKTPNTKYDAMWTIDVVPHDPSVLEDLRERGFRIKAMRDGQEAIVIRRRCVSVKGNKNKEPKLVDAHKNPIDVQVGNGSNVVVQYSEYAGTNTFGPYKGLDLRAVQVLDLVEYGGADGDEFEDFDPESEL
jgi:hypothetical protein